MGLGESARRVQLIQIDQMGGQVVLQPNTAITHVIYDGSSASTLCQMLGIDALSDLPEGTVCVSWNWIGKCKLEVRQRKG